MTRPVITNGHERNRFLTDLDLLGLGRRLPRGAPLRLARAPRLGPLALRLARRGDAVGRAREPDKLGLPREK